MEPLSCKPGKASLRAFHVHDSGKGFRSAGGPLLEVLLVYCAHSIFLKNRLIEAAARKASDRSLRKVSEYIPVRWEPRSVAIALVPSVQRCDRCFNQSGMCHHRSALTSLSQAIPHQACYCLQNPPAKRLICLYIKDGGALPAKPGKNA